MNDLVPFQYQGKDVRVAMVNNEPWFVVADVCNALDIGNPTMAVARLDEDEHALISIEGTNNGNQPLNCVNEPGLYKLIMSSRKPEAKPFQRWVTHDVLPSIRKTGKYETKQTKDQSYREEMLAIRRLNADTKNMIERRKQGEAILDTTERFGKDISSESRMALIAKGVELIAGEPVIALPKVEQQFLSCEQIAKRVGLYSQTGKPHKQAVAALIQYLDIEEEERLTVVESNGSWQGTTIKYAETIIPRLENYVEELQKPDELVLDRVYQVRWQA